MDYLTGWDRTMKNVDVTQDFKREKQQIQQCRGTAHPFTMGDYVVKALVVPIVPEIDALNEGPQWFHPYLTKPLDSTTTTGTNRIVSLSPCLISLLLYKQSIMV